MKKYLFGVALAVVGLAIGATTVTGYAEDAQPTVINGRLMMAGGGAVYVTAPVKLTCTDDSTVINVDTATREDGTLSARIPGCLTGWQVTATISFIYPPNGLRYDGVGQGTVADSFALTNMYASQYMEPPAPETPPVSPTPTIPPATTTPPTPDTPVTPRHPTQPLHKAKHYKPHQPKVGHHNKNKTWRAVYHRICSVLRSH